MMNVQYCHQEGDDKPMLRKQIYRTLYAYECSIFEFAAPDDVATDELIVQIFRTNLIKLLHNNDDQRSITCSKL